MHRKPVRGWVSALFLGLSITSGCVSTAVVKNEPRSEVRFASAAGAQTFFEAYIAKNYTRPMGEHGTISVGVETMLPYSHQECPTDNVLFNAAIRIADPNHDGVITDEEARNYLDSSHVLAKGLVAVSK